MNSTNNRNNETARGIIVLCGGKSSRMGYPKWQLPFGNERMLDRILRITGEISQTQIVVTANAQAVDDLASNVRVAVDEHPDRGPLQGIHAGLAALPETIDAAFVTSCDVPMLSAEFVNMLFELLTPDKQIVVPIEEKFHHPLAAVYRPGVLPVVAELLAAGRRRPIFLFDQVAARRVHVDELRKVDPDLNSLRNLNDSKSYLEAVRQTGFDPDAIPSKILQKLTRTL